MDDTSISLDTALDWIGRHMVDEDGDDIGKIADVYLDRETDEPAWLAVTTGLFGTRVTYVPIGDARLAGDAVQVAWGRDHVKEAPHAEAQGELTEAEEARLFRHYGYEYRAGPPDRPAANPATDLAELARPRDSIEHPPPETGRLRLRRYGDRGSRSRTGGS